MKTFRAGSIAILILSIVSLISCSDDTITNTDTRQPFEIRPYNYSDNHFFIDTVYRQSFEDFYGNLNMSSRTDSLQVDQNYFEVWVQADLQTVGYRKAGLHIDLPELPSGGKYNDSLKIVPNPEQGIRTFGIVRKLQPSEFSFNKFAGYISFQIDIPDNYFAGVAYQRTVTGEQFGLASIDSSIAPADTLILKMVKVQNLIPGNAVAWNMKLRNIYQIPGTNISETGFEFGIYFAINGVYTIRYPSINASIMTILGLDSYTFLMKGAPDDKFDFLPGRTIDPENGWVIFPTLKPFLTNLQNYSSGGGKTIDDTYWYPEIYNELKTTAMQVPNADAYLLKGKTF